MLLKDKVVAITGAASGIGLALSHLLAAEGCVLSLADMNQEPLDAVAKALALRGTKVMSTQLDVRDQTAVDEWIASTVKAFGRLDGAANMAGIFRRSGTIIDSDNKEIESMMAVNFYGVINCMRAQLKAMKMNGGNATEGKVGGSIVNAASTAGLSGAGLYASYVASKHAVMGITKTASREAGPLGIRVNAICPSIVQTQMVSNHERENSFKFSADKNPLQRFATADDVAKVVRFLLSEDSGYINGVGQLIDGGNSASFGG